MLLANRGDNSEAAVGRTVHEVAFPFDAIESGEAKIRGGQKNAADAQEAGCRVGKIKRPRLALGAVEPQDAAARTSILAAMD